MRSMPITATWMRGTVVTAGRCPRSSTSTIEPVSATAKLHARDADVGGEEAGPQLLAGERGEVLRLGVELAAAAGLGAAKMSRTWWRSRWTAGAMMWLGVWPASWMIHSPRSVSTTSHAGGLEGVVEAGLLGGHRLALHDRARRPVRRATPAM